MKTRLIPILLLLALTGCGGSSEAPTLQTISSAKAISIAASEKPKFTRVIALANGSAEIIDALGMKSILVGRDIASTDQSLKSIPIVTSGHQVIPEKIIALAPDLVITDSSVGPSQAIDALVSAGITVKKIGEIWSVGEISAKVKEISGLLSLENSGQLLVEKIDASLASSAQKVSGSPRIAFLYLRGGSAIYLLGGKGSGADSLISAVGGVDVGATDGSLPFSALTGESLINKRPEIILVMTKGLQSVGGVDGLVALPGVAQTPAGKNRRIIAVDDSLLLSFGPRTPALLSALASAINEVLQSAKVAP